MTSMQITTLYTIDIPGFILPACVVESFEKLLMQETELAEAAKGQH
jgi:hypothetical protein